jgi:hypothetical protein
MTKTLSLLHTAPVHRATFDMLGAQIAPTLRLEHHLREDWLTTMRLHGETPDLRAEIASFFVGAGPLTLCTCTSLGSIAEELGALRIDAPMMEAAAARAGGILLVYLLESTAEPSLTLLQETCQSAGHVGAIETLFLGDCWPLFEAGETTQFYAAIAEGIRQHKREGIETIVLAQASMAPVADLLKDLPQATLNAPEMALRAALRRLA